MNLPDLGVNLSLAAAEFVREKDPLTFGGLTYMWVSLLSITGGLVAFINKLKDQEARTFRIAELLGEIVTSGFAGVMAFYICEAMQVGQLVGAVCVGISGHMGSRALSLIEKWLSDKFKNT